MCETEVAASPRGWRVRTAMTVAPGESLDFFIRYGMENGMVRHGTAVHKWLGKPCEMNTAFELPTEKGTALSKLKVFATDV